MRIKDYPKKEKINKGDVVLTDGTNGTAVVGLEELAYTLLTGPNPGATHNAIFRGKNLGSAISKEQIETIRKGEFNDLFIGDYWSIDGVNWRIAGIDHFIGTQNGEAAPDTKYNTDHHIVVVPDTPIASSEYGSTLNGYYSSYLRSTGLAEAEKAISSALGSSNLLTIHGRATSKGVVSDSKSVIIPTDTVEYSYTSDVLNERLVFGHNIYGTSTGDLVNGRWQYPVIFTPFNVQLPLFNIAPQFIPTGVRYWLSDLTGENMSTAVGGSGVVSRSPVNAAYGVRTYTIIG